ncbi:L,D-transpeptidase [Halomicronema sp. CCY15110]|uniref:L,D-transpeptidase n=1 Tax=Halomicronema sp. CCY15110 TaxID=2767773 RepID=UPI001EF170A0|nr:L,D-transpeptidase [Halomicronema sp. CCY15110]
MSTPALLSYQTVMLATLRQSWHCLGVGVASGIVSFASAAWATAQPLQLPDTSTSVALSSVAAPPAIDDPSLFLPKPSERLTLLVLKLSERRLYGYQGDRQVVSYPVAIGRTNWETPTGNFTVLQRQQHPTWQHPFTGELVPPGPDNPLGVRWIGFWTDGNNEIGFHGTPDEHLIGQAVSHGCVRMRNADVVELYERIRLGTRVFVQP